MISALFTHTDVIQVGKYHIFIFFQEILDRAPRNEFVSGLNVIIKTAENNAVNKKYGWALNALYAIVF